MSPTCPHGHPRTPENTGVNWQRSNGASGKLVPNRYCKACRRDRIQRRRQSNACINGHPRVPENIYIHMKDGKQTARCLICHRESARRFHERAALADAAEAFLLELEFRPHAYTGKRCKVCGLMADYRTPRQIRDGLPAEPHYCLDRRPPMSSKRNDGNFVYGHKAKRIVIGG